MSPLKGNAHFGLIKHDSDALCWLKIPGEFAAETRTHVSLGGNAGSKWTGGFIISKMEANVKPAAPLRHRNCVENFLQLKLGGKTCNGSHRARHQKVYTCPLRHETLSIVVTIRLLVVIPLWITEGNWIKSQQSSCQRPDKNPERRQMFAFHAGRRWSVTVIKDIWPVCLLVPGGEDGADAHSRGQVGGRDKMKGSRKCLLGRETCKMENGKSEMESSNGSILGRVSFPSLQNGPSGWAGVNFSWTRWRFSQGA